ncbi:MAG: hypothetical protein AB1921_04425 [Thermodesulfobacteriota bacterium]
MLKALHQGFTEYLVTVPGWEMEAHSISDIETASSELSGLDRSRIFPFYLPDFFDEAGSLVTLRVAAVLDRLGRAGERGLPDLRTGGVASGSDFFNREAEITEIWETVEKGEDCILRAPRRFGKTSLALHLKSRPWPTWRVCYVDLEGDSSPADFIFSLFKALSENPECAECLPEVFATARGKGWTSEQRAGFLELEKDRIDHDWRGCGGRLLGSLGFQKAKLLLILDEFSFLAENICGREGRGRGELEDLLEWFSALRKDKPTGLCFMISGSEHLPSYLRSMGISNDFTAMRPILLTTFDEDKAQAYIFLTMARQNISLPPEESLHILKLMGKPIPYFLQLFLDALVNKCRSGEVLNKDSMEKVYQNELLGTGSKRNFEAIIRQKERYAERNPSLRSAPRQMLSRLALAESVEKKSLEAAWNEESRQPGSFAALFEIIRDDFYLAEKDGQVSFDSKLLRDWWIRHVL